MHFDIYAGKKKSFILDHLELEKPYDSFPHSPITPALLTMQKDLVLSGCTTNVDITGRKNNNNKETY